MTDLKLSDDNPYRLAIHALIGDRRYVSGTREGTRINGHIEFLKGKAKEWEKENRG